MKLNLKHWVNLIVAIIIVGSVSSNASASTLDSSPHATELNGNDKWTFAKNENGINIFFSEFKSGDESFLKIKFENTTSERINFIWSLSKNSEAVVITMDEMIETKANLDPRETEIYGTYSFILINNEESFEDFVVNINLTK
jgi:hypothetical protein